jgi:hypothetical protein
MKRRLSTAAMGAAVLASIWGAGCGKSSTRTPCNAGSVDIRNGTWAVSETVTATGPDSCLNRTPLVADSTGVICNITAGANSSNFNVCCDTQVNGDQVTFDCSGTVDLGICVQDVSIFGGGTVTDSTFDLDFAFTSGIRAKDSRNAQFCQINFGRFADACTTHVRSVGSFVDTTGAYRCGTSSKGVPLEALISHGAGTALTAP